MKKKLIIVSFIILICCTSCVKYSKDLLETSKTQISHEFYKSITYPTDLVVMLSPIDATYINNGVNHPILLHTIIEKRLRNLNFVRFGHNNTVKYAITVKKQKLAGSSNALATGYTDALKNMGISESPYMIEIYLDEVEVNSAGDEILWERVAMFTTPLVRSEEEIANDIVNIIIDEIE